MQTILVSGPSGFIGKKIIEYLDLEGFNLKLVLRPSKLQEFSNLSDGHERIVTNNIFAEKEDWWLRALDGVDALIHAAWYTKQKDYQVSVENFKCLAGSLEMLSAVSQSNIKKLVGLGTCAEYKLGSRNLAVTDPLDPQTPYAISKYCFYKSAQSLLSDSKIIFNWCRLFYVWGDGENKDRFVPYLRGKLEANEPALLSDGSQIRDYVEVGLAARKIVKVATSDITGDFNICSGKAISIREFAERIADEYGKRELLMFGARALNSFDPARVVGISNV